MRLKEAIEIILEKNKFNTGDEGADCTFNYDERLHKDLMDCENDNIWFDINQDMEIHIKIKDLDKSLEVE